MVSTGKCRAKDPRTCYYHGALIRMEKAQSEGDFEGYYQARKLVESTDAEAWVQNEIVNFGSVSRKHPEGSPQNPIASDSDLISDKFVPQAIMHCDVKGVTTTYHQARRGVVPESADKMRIQFNREMAPEDAERAFKLIAYQFRVATNGGTMTKTETDSRYSFILESTIPDNLVEDREARLDALRKFHRSIGQTLIEGTPQRKTKENTRLHEGFGVNPEDGGGIRAAYFYADVTFNEAPAVTPKGSRTA